jgi:hypothetical protein
VFQENNGFVLMTNVERMCRVPFSLSGIKIKVHYGN